MSLRASVLLSALCGLFASQAYAQSCPIPKSCDLMPPPGVPECPVGSGKFLGRKEPGGSICEYTANQSVPLLLVCDSTGYGFVCEAWAQETSTPKQFLTYSWVVKVGRSPTIYASGRDPYLGIPCSQGESVRVQMTLRNGTFQATATQNYSCGALTQ